MHGMKWLQTEIYTASLHRNYQAPGMVVMDSELPRSETARCRGAVGSATNASLMFDLQRILTFLSV